MASSTSSTPALTEMQPTLSPPKFPDASACVTVREALATAGYREADLCTRLGLGGWRDLGNLGRRELLGRAGRLGPPVDVLLRLFMTGLDVDATRAEAALGIETLGAMEASGLLGRDGSQVRARVALTPVGDLAFASDLPERHRSRAADYVLGAGGVTRCLADFTMRTPVDSALDLGCGAGILAGLAAAHARAPTS